MIPNSENSRTLGVGETLRATDYVHFASPLDEDGDYEPLEKHFVGELITGNEVFEFVRVTAPDPISIICDEYGIATETGREALLYAIKGVAVFDQKIRNRGIWK